MCKRYIVCLTALSILCLSSCNDKIEVRQKYVFSLTSWYIQPQIRPGEPVEIRFTLERRGDFKDARYKIGYIQTEGDGFFIDQKGGRLENREMRELGSLPGLDTDDPLKQVFTLYYTSTSEKNAKVKFIVEDNFGQRAELSMSFQVETSDEQS